MSIEKRILEYVVENSEKILEDIVEKLTKDWEEFQSIEYKEITKINEEDNGVYEAVIRTRGVEDCITTTQDGPWPDVREFEIDFSVRILDKSDGQLTYEYYYDENGEIDMERSVDFYAD